MLYYYENLTKENLDLNTSCGPGPCVINNGCNPDSFCTPDDDEGGTCEPTPNG